MDEKILASLNNIYPVDITKVEKVTNEMVRCTAEEGVFFARITNYKSYEEQLEEVKYTNYLSSKGLGVSSAIPSIKGNLVEKISLDTDRDVVTVLYQAAPGIHLPRKEWNAGVLKQLGSQIGRLHTLTQKYEKTVPFQHINDWHKQDEYDFLKYIPKEESTIRGIAEEVLSAIEELPQDDTTYGVIHGDLWLENIHVDDEQGLTLIDFQDYEKHFYIFDLAVPIYSALEYTFAGQGNIRDYERSITQALVEGYREENTLTAEMLDKLPLFMQLKELFEYSLMHMYWDMERLTEEQIRIMNHYRMRLEYRERRDGI